MTTAYSCVVDGGAKFEWQAVNLCLSLMRNAGVEARDIKVHVTPPVSDTFRHFVEDHGMDLRSIAPFPGGHGYCNKIQQMFSPAFTGYDRVVLCDCDLYFMHALNTEGLAAAAAGRVVDRPNPPLPLLCDLFARYDVAHSTIVPVGFPFNEAEQTFDSNWNGGLYVFDVEILERLGTTWAQMSTRLIQDIELLGKYSAHADQIGLSLALNSLAIEHESLPQTQNYPIHFTGSENYLRAPSDIHSFHYHYRMNALGNIEYTGEKELDRQIEQVNENISDLITAQLIRDETLFGLFERWQRHCSTPRPERGNAALTAFQNPRYIRHNARRLEHLASLQLDLFAKSVLEFGAGVGDHSLFFLDRGCHVTSIEPREENVECIAHRHTTEATAFPAGRHRVIRCDTKQSAAFIGTAKFQIVYNYGLFYHLDDPEAFLRQSAAYCEDLYLLETAVLDLTDNSSYVEDHADLTNGVDGGCVLLSRQGVVDILRERFPYVYVPRTQPAHEQFLTDWSVPPQPPVNRHRSVFVGSMRALPDSLFATEVLNHHGR